MAFGAFRSSGHCRIHFTYAVFLSLGDYWLYTLRFDRTFLYYFVKREDLGDAEGPYHSAAHLAAWSVLSVFFLAIVWCFLDLFQKIWEKA